MELDVVATERCESCGAWVVDLVDTTTCISCAGLEWALRRTLAVAKLVERTKRTWTN